MFGFGFEDNVYDAAVNASVLEQRMLDQIRDDLEQIKAMKAVFDKHYVKKLDGKNVGKNVSIKCQKAKLEFAMLLATIYIAFTLYSGLVLSRSVVSISLRPCGL